MTFKEKYQAGEIEFEAIDDYVDEWNNSDDERTLAKFLGLNADEEDAWIDDGDEVLKEMLDVMPKDISTTVIDDLERVPEDSQQEAGY